MLVIYRSPLSADGTTIDLFLSEFSNLLEQIITDPKPIIIFGDFNLHVDLPNDVAALKFLDRLETFGLKQHVNVVTHRCGHILDLVITRSDDDLVLNLNVTDPIISDHLAVHCKNIAFKKPSYKRKEI